MSLSLRIQPLFHKTGVIESEGSTDVTQCANLQWLQKTPSSFVSMVGHLNDKKRVVMEGASHGGLK